MSSDGLKKAVLEKARAEAGEILARAKAQNDARVMAAKKEAAAVSAEIVGQAKREAVEARARALSAAEREVRLKTLAEKNRLLDEVMSRAHEALKKKDLSAILEKELHGMELKGAVVRVAPGDKAKFEKIVGGRARVQTDAKMDGGWIIEREDFRLDRTLKSMLKEVADEIRADVARALFEEGA